MYDQAITEGDLILTTLRPYQEEAVSTAIKRINLPNGHRDKKGAVLVLPTGAGKSHIIAEICRRTDRNVLILQPSKEILEQNYDKLKATGITDIGKYSASVGQKTFGKYTYATIGSIYKKPELFTEYKTVLVDECHLVNPKKVTGMYNTFFSNIQAESIVGLTATPYRLEQKYRRDEYGQLFTTTVLTPLNRIFPFFFREFAYIITIKQLLDEGYLCPLTYVDASRNVKDNIMQLRLNSNGSDFTESSISKLYENDKAFNVLVNVVRAADHVCKKNLIFVPTVSLAYDLCDHLRSDGMSVDVVVSESMSGKERTAKINKFKDGTTKNMVNVGVLTTGFDLPDLDCITLARPTVSLGLLYQMVGRGMRIAPGKKNCKVFDVSGSVARLGRVDTIGFIKEDGYKDVIVTERGRISGVTLAEHLVEEKLVAEEGEDVEAGV